MLDSVQRAALDWAASRIGGVPSASVFVEPDGALCVGGYRRTRLARKALVAIFALAAEWELRHGSGAEFVGQSVEELRARGLGKEDIEKIALAYAFMCHEKPHLLRLLALYDAASAEEASTGSAGKI